MTKIKPFIKWVGGKTQIIDDITNNFPREMNNYHECFLGGGSVLLSLLNNIRDNKIKVNNRIYAYDINEYLIGVFNNIKTDVNKLYDEIIKICEIYDNIKEYKSNNMKPKTIEEAKVSKEAYYYWLRSKFNSLTDRKTYEASALFCVINKLCFRGLYREGPNGFNVPYGNYKTYYIPSKEEFLNISSLIQNVEFKCCNYVDMIKDVKEGDFVYYDPPYVPENKTSFTSYNVNGFNKDNHLLLFKNIKNIKNYKFMLSNSYTNLVIEEFNNTELYKIKKIECKRSINSKNPGSKTYEVIITNF